MVSVTLTAADIPGADLSEPLESHAVPALRWWLLCRGLKGTFKSEETASARSVSKILIDSLQLIYAAADLFLTDICCKYYAAGFARLSRIMLRLLM